MSTQREIVESRARGRCEYCMAPQVVAGYTFHIEHIHPRIKGGKDALSNYALACATCNFAKSNHIYAVDTKTSKKVLVFNPRSEIWTEHFRFSQTTLKIIGKTATGRATENCLRLNSARQMEARALWIKLGVYP